MITKKVKVSLNNLRFVPFDKITGIAVTGDYNNCCPSNVQEIQIEDYVRYDNIVLKPFFNIKINLSNKFKCLGQFTDTGFIKVSSDMFTFQANSVREVGMDIYKYGSDSYWVRGCTENKLDFVKSYTNSDVYRINLNISDDPLNCFTGVIAKSVDRVTYVIDGQVGASGNYIIGTGVIYETFDNFKTVIYTDSCETTSNQTRITNFKIKTDNSDFGLSALTHECYNLEIAYPERVENNVLVDRSMVAPNERFTRLNEIGSLRNLLRYKNGGYFNYFES